MNNSTLHAPAAYRFRRFMRERYAAYASMHRVINIGVVAASTLLFAFPNSAQAQTEMKHKPAVATEESPIALDEVEVTASRAPIALQDASRIVTVITAREIAAAPVASVQELLSYVAGVDVRQRGTGGTQADVSIRGGTADQIAVLLNGINLSNPQTGHYSFDLPVNLSDIDHIEVVYGPSGRIFGASAFAGAINIVTKTHNENSLTTSDEAGMHGLWKVEGGWNAATKSYSQRLSGSYASSDGYMDNTDYKIANGFWQSMVRTSSADIQMQAGINEKHYGANSFYSAAYPNQKDNTQRMFVSAGAETKGAIKFTPRAYWMKSTDRFQLFRNNPASWYTSDNYHETHVFGFNMNAEADWALGRTVAGLEFRDEGVRSNVLGTDLSEKQKVPGEDAYYTKSADRSNVSYFLEHNVKWQRFTLSAGVLANHNSSLHEPVHFYPGADISFRVTDNFKLYANWNRSLRMPTFTDLYYKSKTNQGNVNLKPEKSEASEFGMKYANSFISADADIYYRKGKDMIDWVKKNSGDIWESRNLTEVNNLGVETNVRFLPRNLWGQQCFIEKAEFSYAYIHQNKNSEGLISNYALDYLKNKFTAELSHRIWKEISATWYFRHQDRVGGYTKYVNSKAVGETPYKPYSTLDLKVNWQHNLLGIYAEANNIFDKTYYDLGNIPQPGFWFKAGFTYTLPL